ncbi:MAG: hypothetical protein ACXVFV_00730 [Mycobacteriales bacterium]
MSRSRFVVCALALVAGLLGMHGLASDHVAMHGAGTAAVMPGVMTSDAHAGHLSLGATHGSSLPYGPAALCLAVLGGGLVLLLGLGGSFRRTGAGLARPGAARAPGRQRRPRPPDPVTVLCVSRT